MAFTVRVAVEGARTNWDGRALLGVAADYLQRAFALIPDLSTMAGVQDNARELLERVNDYATQLYGLLPDDGAPLDETMRARISVALNQASENLLLVQSVDAALQWNFLQALADVIPTGIAAIVGAAGSVAFDHWALTIGLVVMALVVLPWILRRGAA